MRMPPHAGVIHADATQSPWPRPVITSILAAQHITETMFEQALQPGRVGTGARWP
jgi:hypothetical protein